MEFLKRVLGMEVTYLEEAPKTMPNFINSRYTIKKVDLDGKPAIFVYPREELDPISTVKKHLERIKRTEEASCVLLPNYLTYRQKEYLLRDHIPFVVDGKQIYLPFMAVYLQERSDAEKREVENMLPSAQLLLLHYIYRGCRELSTSEAAQILGFTATSISRASRQLEDMGFVRTEKRGVHKILLTDKTPKEMFYAAKGRMSNPVKKSIYLPKKELDNALLMSGYLALAEYTMLNPPNVDCFAAGSIREWERNSSLKLQNTEEQCKVELWWYDPGRIVNGTCVDRLSLALALAEDKDERVEEAVEEMLKNVWEDIDGKRN